MRVAAFALAAALAAVICLVTVGNLWPSTKIVTVTEKVPVEVPKVVPLAKRTNKELRAELGKPAGSFPSDDLGFAGTCYMWADQQNQRVLIGCWA